MTHTLQVGISLLIFLLFGCHGGEPHMNIINIDVVEKQDHFRAFNDYCYADSINNIEEYAVKSAMFGEYQKTLRFARKREEWYAESAGTNVGDNFKEAELIDAVSYIVGQAKEYKYTLINEAHFSSQHRAFTQELLKPLWEQGYRYLALETLGYEDSLIQRRGYPLYHTGHYTQDPVFSNLVRSALTIGYELVPYEVDYDLFLSQGNGSASFRDSIQAQNIFSSTDKKPGKVLVHAGYSHINKATYSTYKPMGAELKGLSDFGVLSVDQVTMSEAVSGKRLHPYYEFISNNYDLELPIVVVNKQGKSIIDPVNASGIDIQVYHPATDFIQGRPAWLLVNDKQLYPLPDQLSTYQGLLLQAFNVNDDSLAVPLDQFVIDGKKALALKPGSYVLKIIDCSGALKAKVKAECL